MAEYLPVLRRVLGGALDCISEGRPLIGSGEWELEEVMDHLQLDHPEGLTNDLRQLADDIDGAESRVSASAKPTECAACDGLGYLEGPDPGWYETTCPHCGGTGEVPANAKGGES